MNIAPRETLQFNATTYRGEEKLTGTYQWYLSSTLGGSIDEKGLYKAGPAAGTGVVTVIDIAHGNSLATAEVKVSPLWPMAYDKMWGARKRENLSHLRSFRDRVLAESKAGRKYTSMLYSNSMEILTLLTLNPSLTKETKEVIDELLPGIQSLLEDEKTLKKKKAVIDKLLPGKQSLRKSKKISLSKEQIANIESLAKHFDKKASSPKLKRAIRRVRRDLRKGILFKQFDITGNKVIKNEK